MITLFFLLLVILSQMDDQSLVYTLDEALSATEFGNFQGLVLFYAGLGWFADAMEIMLLSFVGPTIKSEWGLSSREEGLLTTVVFAGMLLGAYLWGLISDNYGRRHMSFLSTSSYNEYNFILLINAMQASGLCDVEEYGRRKDGFLTSLRGFLGIAIVTSVAGFLSSFSPNYMSLLILRCLVGTGLGGGSVFSSWFLEFIPASNRGKWMVIFSTFWTIGTIFEASLAWIVMPRLNWRWLLGLSSIPSFALVLFYGLVPESPRYLCAKDRVTDAQLILEKIALLNQTRLPCGMLISDRITEQDEEFAPPNNTPLLSSPKHKAMDFKRAFSSFLLLFSPKFIQTTLLLWVLYFGNSFSYYGIILLTSELSLGKSKCHSITLHSDNFQNSSLYIDVFITSLAEIPGLLLSAIIVDRMGRKLSMIIMFILACVFLLPLAYQQSATLTIVSLFGARMCTIGSFTVACIYAPELYPTSMRATGAGTANAMGRIGGMICPLVAVGLVTGCNQTAAVLLFEAVMVLSVVSVLLFRFETMGQKLSNT
ncbi:hypothetical protein FNV43_RR19441 [Rhamnella rubrinervis]|uniref:Major facilitator superfamily (MFS) profile domain-containing protein n=1 Tax=Rhamnella rubrinervis TaxID=2594499 RepID=A0A8K0DYS9_9ROSA|nr:hypothetical protein FNV43_RR19441 [Rhamnella rubrinervis]